MPNIPGGGIRFAVPDINNIKSAGYSDAAGAQAFGPNGQRYRVVFNREAASAAAGANAFIVTETGQSAIGDLFSGALAGSSFINTNWLGIWVTNVGGTTFTGRAGIGWMQVGGPVVLSFNAASGATASVATTWLPAAVTGFETFRAITTASLPFPNLYAVNGGPGYSAAQTTAMAALIPGRL